MAVVKNLMTRAGFDASGMSKGIRKAQSDLQMFKSNVSRTMKGIAGALATIGIGAAIKGATKEAMGFEAAVGQIDRTMGGSARSFKQWTKDNAASFGMARAEATKYGAVFSNLISGFTSGTAQTAQYTQDLLKASAVISSSTGRTIEDTMDRIRSGMLGSTEAIEDLGINVNVAMIEATDAFKRFANGKSWQQLDFQTQQTVRYFAILEQSVKKYGTEIAQNANSDQAKFIAQMKNAQLTMGQAFLPIYTAILPALTRFATSLANVMNTVAQFSQALFGSKKAQDQANAVTNQASAVEGLGDAYTDAGKAAKDSVAGFDQVNLIGGESGGGSGAAGLIPTDTTEQVGAFDNVADAMNGVSEKAQEMAAKVKAAFAEMSGFIKTHKDLILASLSALGVGFATFWTIAKGGAAVTAIRTAFMGIAAAIGAVSIPILLISAGIAALTGAFVYFYRTNESFRGVVESILQKIGEVATWLWQNVLAPFGQFLATVMVEAWRANTVAVQWLWKNVLAPLGNFLLWMNKNVITPIASVLADVLAKAFGIVADVAESFWKNVLVPLGNAINEVLSPAAEALSAVLTFLWQNVMKPLGAYIGNQLKLVFKALADVIVWLYDYALKPIAGYLGGVFVSTFNRVFETIGGVINGAKTAFIGLMNFITGVFTGDWERAWNGVKGVFAGVFESLYAIVKAPLNSIIDMINTVIGGLNKIAIDIPDIPGLPGGGSKIGISIPKIPKLEVGTNYVARDGLAFLHEGEAVVPKEYNPAAGGGDNREVVAALNAILQAVRNGQKVNVSISQREIGRAAISEIREETRRTGRSPVMP